MGQAGSATIDIPGVPPARDHLFLRLELENRQSTGDCIPRFDLNVVPVLDKREPLVSTIPMTIRSGGTVHLNIGNAQQFQVRVTLYMRGSRPDLACFVDLHVTDAILYNKGVL